MTRRTKKPRGVRTPRTLDDFLAKKGKREEFETAAVNKALGWQNGFAQDYAKAASDSSAERNACEWIESCVGDTLADEDFSGWPGYPAR